MGDTIYEAKTSEEKSNLHAKIAFRHCHTELRLNALERLLSEVFKTPTTIMQLLKDAGLDDSTLETFDLAQSARIAEMTISLLRARLDHGEFGERRYSIIERFFGLDGHLPARLSAIATRYGVSRERARQIKERALTILRQQSTKTDLIEFLAYQAYRIMGAKPSTSTVIFAKDGSRGDTCAAKTQEENSNIHAKLLSHRELLMAGNPLDYALARQALVLEQLSASKRLSVQGVTGSGKTWLALVTAQRLAAQGCKTLLTCFNRNAAFALAEHCKNMDNLTVVSFHALCHRFGRAAGVTIPGGWNTRVWMEQFPEVLKKAVERHPGMRFDAIVVDDAHDAAAGWWNALVDCLVEGREGRVYAFFDPNLDKPAISNFRAGLFSKETPAILEQNIRTPANLGYLLTGTAENRIEMKFSREYRGKAAYFPCDNREDTAHALAYVLDELSSKYGIQANETVVLTPFRTESSFAGSLKLKGRNRLVKSISRIANHATLSKFNTFSGLERKATILVDIDKRFLSLNESDARRFLYQGCSRFSHDLYILGSSEGISRIERLSSSRSAYMSTYAPPAMQLKL